MSFDLEKFRQTKVYDLVISLPLIFWFGYVEAIRARPSLGYAARQLMADPGSLYLNMRFVSLFASIAFNLLAVYLIVTRGNPVRRSRGWLPNACGIVGTFISVGIPYLSPVTLPFGWQVVSTALVLVGSVGSFMVLAKLGRSFSILPEARVLVTSGPYGYARHPLYAVEIITILGMAMLYQQPQASLLAAGVILMLVVRTIFEEKVLTEAYPEYAAYSARVKRFGFI
jgi:protein-S-isoprenylcysteine O-methyltransferase Ste14